MNKSTTIQIRITPEMKTKLEHLASEDGRKLSDYVRRVLELHLKSVECFDENFVSRVDGSVSTKAAHCESSVWIPDIESPKVVID